MQKTIISFSQIAKKVEELDLSDYDLVIGIATGAVVLASLIAFQSKLELKIISINYRFDDNRPRYSEPRLCNEFRLDKVYKNILLVDDVSVSGKTFATAKTVIGQESITTLAIKGKADIVLFENIPRCISLPWRDY